MKHLLRPVTSRISEQEKRIDLVTKGSVEFWSLDNPDTGRGRKYATVVIDEAAMVRRLEEAFEQNIAPLLLDYDGDAWLISTPKGRNYFETLHQRGRSDNPNRDPEWQSWQLPTWENPFIKRESIEKLRATMSRLAFLQEIEAQFVSFAGTFVFAEHIHTGTPPEGLTLYMGVDLALSLKESADYTAIVVLGVEPVSGRVWLVDAERRRVGFRDQLHFIADKAKRWRPVDILVEATQFQAVVVEELLRSTDLPVRQVRPDKDKLTRAQGLITRYENHLVWHSNTLSRDYVDEILSFGPDCDHDDLVDAAVYAFMASGDHGRAQIFIPEILEVRKPLPFEMERDVCGRCESRVDGYCVENGYRVSEVDISCILFRAKETCEAREVGWNLPEIAA